MLSVQPQLSTVGLYIQLIMSNYLILYLKGYQKFDWSNFGTSKFTFNFELLYTLNLTYIVIQYLIRKLSVTVNMNEEG